MPSVTLFPLKLDGLVGEALIERIFLGDGDLAELARRMHGLNLHGVVVLQRCVDLRLDLLVFCPQLLLVRAHDEGEGAKAPWKGTPRNWKSRYKIIRHRALRVRVYASILVQRRTN